MYRQRFYRDFSRSERWVSYRVQVESSDLFIRSRENQAYRMQQLVRQLRREINEHIQRQPEFLDSLTPVEPMRRAPSIVQSMYRAADLAGIGPMGAVAGAVAERVGRALLGGSEEVIVENGGDNFLVLQAPCISTIFAGQSVFSGHVGLRIQPEQTPLAVCTSSGTIGHSYSQGRADAATILAADAALADAVATGTANRIANEGQVEASLEYAMAIPGILGAVLICGRTMAARGAVELVNTSQTDEPAEADLPTVRPEHRPEERNA
jgi:hypothetical protein